MGRLLQIGFIWFGCAVAWVILGSTLVVRSGETSSALVDEVHALWGPELAVRPPTGSYTVVVSRTEKTVTRDVTGKEIIVETTKDEPVVHEIPLEGSDLHARLRMTQRQKGLMWFPTYEVELSGRYRFRNDTAEMREIAFAFPLPGEHAIFDGFTVLDEDGRAMDISVAAGAARWSALLKPDESSRF